MSLSNKGVAMNLRKPKLGLAAKFSFLTSLPILMASLVLSFSFIINTKRTIDREIMEKGTSIAWSLSNSVEYGTPIGGQKILNRAIRNLIEGENVLYVFIRNASGEVLARYSQEAGSAPEDILRDGLTRYVQMRGRKYRVTDTAFLQEVICDVLTVREGGSREDMGLVQPGGLPTQPSRQMEKIGTVQVGLSKEKTNTYLRQATLGVILMSIVVTALGITATVTLVRLMVRPVKRLAVAAGEVAHGNFDHPVEVTSKDEIGDLAYSFNKMMVDLRASREALQYQLEMEERMSRELEQKAEELSRTNEELNSFVYTVSHDLKAPLVSIQGFSSLLMSDCDDRLEENGKMYVDRIQKNTERMGKLIEDLLELSRIGRLEEQEELVDISDIVSDVADELAPQMEERGTKLIVKDDMPLICCSRTRMRQVFANLIGNAHKFMGEDNKEPTIEVACEYHDSYYTFRVKDNGIGIDEEHHERIFRVFHQLGDVESEGTGVGLTIVKRVIENLGGKIWVESAKGKGCSIYFTIPRVKSNAAQDENMQ